MRSIGSADGCTGARDVDDTGVNESQRDAFTVVGGSGFIGARLCRWLSAAGFAVWAPARGEMLDKRPLGHVLYAAGVTADFRERPLDTIHAHVSDLVTLLETAEFHSLLYLSSARVYRGATSTSENASCVVNPLLRESVYDISKLMGESACFSCDRRDVRVVRLSNVYGVGDSSNNFLTSVIRDALNGRIRLESALSSAKDYVAVEAVVPLLARIALHGRAPLYNVASGANTSHAEIVDLLTRETECSVVVRDGAPEIRVPPISIERVKAEFAFQPSSVLEDLPGLIRSTRSEA